MTSMKRILVVDDEKSIRNTLKDILGYEKYEVSDADSGMTALEMLKLAEFDVILLDIKMPQMDGFELLAYVMEHYPEIQVLVTSGHSIPVNKQAAFKNLSVLSKPFLLKDLNQQVGQLLERQSDGGKLYNVSPAMFLQLIDMEAKTCTIRIQEKNTGKLGILFFQEGKLLDARMNGLLGEAATQEIFSWDLISLTIQNDCPVQEKKINKTLNALILEASRLKDEKAEESKTTRPTQKSAAPPDVPTSARSGRYQEICRRLQEADDVKGYIRATQPDPQWKELLDQIIALGRLFQAGSLIAAGVSNGTENDAIIIPAAPPIAITIDPKCPKERIYRLLE